MAATFYQQLQSLLDDGLTVAVAVGVAVGDGCVVGVDAVVGEGCVVGVGVVVWLTDSPLEMAGR